MHDWLKQEVSCSYDCSKGTNYVIKSHFFLYKLLFIIDAEAPDYGSCCATGLQLGKLPSQLQLQHLLHVLILSGDILPRALI